VTGVPAVKTAHNRDALQAPNRDPGTGGRTLGFRHCGRNAPVRAETDPQNIRENPATGSEFPTLEADESPPVALRRHRVRADRGHDASDAGHSLGRQNKRKLLDLARDSRVLPMRFWV